MKYLITILALFFFASCNSDQITGESVDVNVHLKEQLDKSTKRSLKEINNEFDGRLLKLKVEEYLADYTKFYVIHGGIFLKGNSYLPILLKKSDNFQDHLIDKKRQAQRDQAIANRMMNEGSNGLYGSDKKTVDMPQVFLLVKPIGKNKYMHPLNNEEAETLYYEPKKICKTGWKE